MHDIDIAQYFSFRRSYSLYTISGTDGLEFSYGTDIEFSHSPFTSHGAMRSQSPSVSKVNEFPLIGGFGMQLKRE
ncbi:MAG TPA: hypothetical protein VFO10_11065 [Oligoflexus sp.]|uniref:hypothetical protein n=1 Tax=Oligoflexus sp. TaxID=1971216 RepID=UPI002D7E4D4A|nr:hypothetical protein [Oligoflexus sp.]HET9237784.1 hypothetical protein [Oligoflexus sp.]